MTPDEFRKQVKDALEHLYDTAYLQVHPLLNQVTDGAMPNRLTRAQKLRSLLKETIERLHPQTESPASSPAWRSYLALRYHYVQGMSMAETEHELSISLRQLQRELHKGLDALSALLWEMRATPLSTEVGEMQEVQDELKQWALTRQACDVHALIDDTLSMLQSALSQQSTAVQVDLPAALPPVFVDSTLTRQALLKIMRWAIQQAEGNSIRLQASVQAQQVRLSLEHASVASPLSAEDWQIAQLLISQQGGALEAETSADSGTQIIMCLPRASPTRVLVIDDNQAIHQLFERYLAPHHYEVLHARNGHEALQLALRAQPHLMTLDVMMPNVDGWQVLRSLAQNPATSHIPIIICSVLKEPELAFSLGARAYLKKPVDRVELLMTLARLQPAASPAEAKPPPAPPDS